MVSRCQRREFYMCQWLLPLNLNFVCHIRRPDSGRLGGGGKWYFSRGRVVAQEGGGDVSHMEYHGINSLHAVIQAAEQREAAFRLWQACLVSDNACWGFFSSFSSIICPPHLFTRGWKIASLAVTPRRLRPPMLKAQWVPVFIGLRTQPVLRTLGSGKIRTGLFKGHPAVSILFICFWTKSWSRIWKVEN